MKAFLEHHWIPLLAIICLIVGFAVLAAAPERIRWTWNGSPILFQVKNEHIGRLEFGLRNDGVVVWREIMPATTNSPAEQTEAITNYSDWMTNRLKPEWTNILIKPLYFHHRGPNGEWTNWEEGARWWSNQVKPLLD